MKRVKIEDPSFSEEICVQNFSGGGGGRGRTKKKKRDPKPQMPD